MSKSRGIKSPNGRRPKKLSTHAEDDAKRRRGRINLTISTQARNQLSEIGPTKTSLGVVGQTSNNVELGIRILFFLTHGGNADTLAVDIVQFSGDVSRYKEDGSAYTRMSSLIDNLTALGKSTSRVVASRAESRMGDGSVTLTKGKS